MRIVALEREIFIAERVDGANFRIDFHSRQWPGGSGQLGFHLFEVIDVEVKIAESVNEVTRLEITYLRHHEGQERIGSDVEWDSQKQIGTPLVKLTTEPSIGDVKLE